MAGKVGDGGGSGELAQSAPENVERAGASLTGQVEPAGALRRIVKIAAIEPHQPVFGQCWRGFLVSGLLMKDRIILHIIRPAFDTALLPALVNGSFQPGHLRLARFRVKADNRMVARVADIAALVIPYKRVVAFIRAWQLDMALFHRRDVIDKLHDMVMVKR